MFILLIFLAKVFFINFLKKSFISIVLGYLFAFCLAFSFFLQFCSFAMCHVSVSFYFILFFLHFQDFLDFYLVEVKY